MIRFLHGENIVKSRLALMEIINQSRENGLEVETLNGQQLTFDQLRPALSSGSLFGTGKLVVVENLFSSPKSKRKENLIDFLKKAKLDQELVLWEGKEIKGKLPANFSVLPFKLPAIIFNFLDSLKPGNQRESLRLLEEVKIKEDEEMIFYLLLRQVRFLLLAKDLGENGLNELQSWQKRKFLSQAESFSLEQLKRINQELLKIDYQQKTSQSPLSLASSLDLLVASI